MCPEQTRILCKFRLPNLRGRSFNDFFRGPRNRKAKCQNMRLERGRRLKFQFEKLKSNVKKDGSNRQKIQQTALEKWPPFYDQSTRNVLYNSSKSGNFERGDTFSSHYNALSLFITSSANCVVAVFAILKELEKVDFDLEKCTIRSTIRAFKPKKKKKEKKKVNIKISDI